MKITIPVSYKSSFEVFLIKLNKKATRQGLTPLKAEFSELYETEQTLIESDSYDKTFMVSVLDVTLSDHVPTFKGWSFVARVEKLDSGENIFHSPNSIAIPDKFKNSGHTCEHCNQKRVRNSSYLLQSLEGFKQVGSTCINDFLGNDKALNAFKFQDYIFIELKEFERDSCGNSVKSLLDVSTVLAYSNQQIALHGFVKSSGFDGYGPSPTAHLVSHAMNTRETVKKISEDETREAEIIKAYFANLPVGESEYLNKLASLCRASSCDKRNLNILVSAVATYNRKQNEVEKVSLESNYQGTIKDKLTLDVTVKSTYILPDYGYGESMLITFQDATGNIYLWKSSSVQEIDKGETFKIKGTVKEHSEYKGTKQTVLTRCKFI